MVSNSSPILARPTINHLNFAITNPQFKFQVCKNLQNKLIRTKTLASNSTIFVYTFQTVLDDVDTFSKFQFSYLHLTALFL